MTDLDWQPIASAPKDRAVLVTWPADDLDDDTWPGGVRVRVAYWDKLAIGGPGYGPTGWTDVTTGEGCLYHYGALPTHWMPLPPVAEAAHRN